MDNKTSFDIPVLLITYKRLDTLKKVVDSMRMVKPKYVYVASDGPKSFEKDFKKITQVREYIINALDWDCEVKTLFRDKNVGCKYGPQEAISWLFENEKEGIILEDDCVPNLSFYRYCQILLEKYRNDLRVFNIAGSNIVPELSSSINSYFFSNLSYTWGWATWKDRWKIHLHNIDTFEKDSKENLVYNVLKNKTANKMLLKNAVESFNDKMDAWDYIWAYTLLINNGLSITPKNNLIENVGFGPDATHTKVTDTNITTLTNELEFPLQHPNVILPDYRVDNHIFEEVFNWKNIWQKLNPSHIKRVIQSRMKTYSDD